MTQNKIALVTGATAGIGEATAQILAEQGINLIITGRRDEKLQKLKSSLEKNHKIVVKTLSFDIRSYEETEKAWNSLDKKWQTIDYLINNAGLAAGLDYIHEGSLEDWNQMIDTNIKGLLNISRLVLPVMAERKTGHVINIGSIAGKETYEKGGVYCATKHAVEAITKGMRIDMLQHGVKVTSVCPGMVETEFSLVRYKGDEERAKNVYKGLTPLTAEDIADTIWFVLSRPAHVCINDILIMPTAQASSGYVVRK
ncbi:MAG: SDR family oxidoreductase [Salinivirgaceae bacterium]|jgi:3-hydroxy acid dehydrogenase/malonic semialdehyde reductase|nr:SDR family oxidoreductase [Bacteroidales bacterium]